MVSRSPEPSNAYCDDMAKLEVHRLLRCTRLKYVVIFLFFGCTANEPSPSTPRWYLLGNFSNIRRRLRDDGAMCDRNKMHEWHLVLRR